MVHGERPGGGIDGAARRREICRNDRIDRPAGRQSDRGVESELRCGDPMFGECSAQRGATRVARRDDHVLEFQEQSIGTHEPK